MSLQFLVQVVTLVISKNSVVKTQCKHRDKVRNKFNFLYLSPLTSVFFQPLKVKLHEPKNEEIYEKYVGENEQYGNEYVDYDSDKQGKVS